jgi:hypothetical protein
MLDVCRYGMWYAFLLAFSPCLPTGMPAKAAVAPWLPNLCWLLVGSGIVLQLGLLTAWIKPEEWQSGLVFLGLAEAVVGLILVEQLFRTVSGLALEYQALVSRPALSVRL